MPALSKQQQKLFGLALAVKRGDVPKSKVSDEIRDIVDKMSEKDIEKFAKTKHKGLPNKKEEMSENVSAEELIDIIDLDPSNKRYDKYKKMLKDLHDIDYVEPKIRYKKEVAIIKKYDNNKFNTKTNKGIDVTVVVKKIPNLTKSLSVEVYDELGNIVGRAGFSIDDVSKTIRIGGATVNSSMRRKGIYSTIVDYIEKVARENKLKIVDRRPGSKYSGRSADAVAFWKNRMEKFAKTKHKGLPMKKESIIRLDWLKTVAPNMAKQLRKVMKKHGVSNKHWEPAVNRYFVQDYIENSPISSKLSGDEAEQLIKLIMAELGMVESFEFKMESLINKIDEKWSDKYKRSIDCNNPKGFSQKAHCKGRKKK